MITVGADSNYAKMAKKLGGNMLPSSFRAGNFTEKTDPYRKGITKEEAKSRRRTTYPRNSQKKDIKSGSVNSVRGGYLPRQ